MIISSKGVEIDDMIEKFSEEELYTILEELGIDKKSERLYTIVSKQRKRLRNLLNEKPCLGAYDKTPISEVDTSIRKIIAITMSNLTKNKKGNWITSTSLKEKDAEEHLQMYTEIVDIIEKHNREWNNNNS